MESFKWLTVYFTHIEDGLVARQQAYLSLWGQKDRNLYLGIEQALRELSPRLNASLPPKDLSDLEGHIAVLINSTWVRGSLVEKTLRADGKVDVFCIDLGLLQSVPLSCVRTLNAYRTIPESSLIFDCLPQAHKFILADVISPQVGWWPETSISFAKTVLENEKWMGLPLGTEKNRTVIRLYNDNNKLLAKTMIDKGLGLCSDCPSMSKSSHQQVKTATSVNEAPEDASRSTLPEAINAQSESHSWDIPLDPVKQPFPTLCDPPPSNVHTPSVREKSDKFSDLQQPLELPSKDLLLPHDGSCDGEGKNTAGTPVPLPVAEEATIAIADEIEERNLDWKENEIISKNAVLCRFDGADKIWLHFNTDKVESLMAEIADFSTKPEFATLPPFREKIEKACLAPYKISGADCVTWFRGILLDIDEDTGTVFYVDFGNSQKVKISDLKSLPLRFAKQPRLAYCCTLEGIDCLEKRNNLARRLVEIFWLMKEVEVQCKAVEEGKFTVSININRKVV